MKKISFEELRKNQMIRRKGTKGTYLMIVEKGTKHIVVQVVDKLTPIKQNFLITKDQFEEIGYVLL